MLPDDLALGPVHLRVADLTRSIAWYQDVIGLTLRGQSGDVATLGTELDDVIVLHEVPGARRLARHSGLYHVALLYESRLELARVLQRIEAARTPVDGFSDHGTHEAIYLPDPDENGLELAADRPREVWLDLADVTAIAPKPLDIGDLFNLVSGRAPEPQAGPATRVGHLHLHVADLTDSLHFYRDLIGFDVITEIDTAVFVSAGGYHHHLAFNIWQGRGAPPTPDDATGLLHWSIELPTGDDVAAVQQRLEAAEVTTQVVEGGFETADPSGNHLRVTTSQI